MAMGILMSGVIKNGLTVVINFFCILYSQGGFEFNWPVEGRGIFTKAQGVSRDNASLEKLLIMYI